MKSSLIISSLTAIVLLTSGCSSKQEVEYNKSAEYWYQKMVKEIGRGELEKADQTFTSLQSEHIRSPFVEESLMMLTFAHMDKEEYLLANFYLDEYIKRFSTQQTREYARFLKVKAGFLGFKNAGREQQLLQDTIKDAKQFLNDYPSSQYEPMVGSMLAKLLLADNMLNQNIATLYDKLGKPQAATFYRSKQQEPWLSNTPAQAPYIPWYRRSFE